MKFVIPFQREGASEVILNLTTNDSLLSKYDQENHQIEQNVY